MHWSSYLYLWYILAGLSMSIIPTVYDIRKEMERPPIPDRTDKDLFWYIAGRVFGLAIGIYLIDQGIRGYISTLGG